MTYHRIGGLIDLSIVGSKKLTLVGAGSLGSLTAELLAYPWREFVVIDPENLGPENIERHLLGKEWLGKSKARGVALWLLDRCGGLIVDCQTDRVQEVMDEHWDSDLLLLLADREAAEWVNRQNVSNVPIITGGIYARGIEGEIIFLPNPKDVCLTCADALYPPPEATVVDNSYGIQSPQPPLTTPALRNSVAILAAQIANLALQFIHNEDREPKLVRWARDWSTIATFKEGGEAIELFNSWVKAQAMFGSLPNVRIQRGDDQTRVSVRGMFLEFPIGRWDNCPYH